MKTHGPESRRVGRRALRGNALLEFVLTLPIIIFMAGVTMYMSMAMLTKQQTLVDARASLWRSAGHGTWTNLKLEDHVPGTVEDDGTRRPRGSGEELDRLRQDIWDDLMASTRSPGGREYGVRLWDNLPGRHESEASRSFETQGSLWNFIQRSAASDHFRDSSPWHFNHLDAWRIARSGPLREIVQSFVTNLEQATVAPHFEQTRQDIMNRWWHGEPIDTDDPNNY